MPTTTERRSGSEGLLAESRRCENPQGWSVSYPADWSVNGGSVVPPCSQFNPEPFDVPAATDERVAAIAAYVDAVAYGDVAGENGAVDGTRAVTVVDGQQAVRISGVTAGSQLHDDGTPVTRYLIDLSVGVDDGPGTLFIETIGATGDYQMHRRILDAMVPTIDLVGADVPDEVVARYEGGGAPVVVTARPGDDEICMSLGSAEGRACVAPPTRESPIRSVLLDDGVRTVLAGVAAGNVFRIEMRRAEGEPFALLPSAIELPTIPVKGWAFPSGVVESAEFSWFDHDDNELGSRTLEPPPDDGADVVGEPASDPVTSDEFPAVGPPALLTDVRVGVHDGFQRVVFEFEAENSLSYRVDLVDEVVGPSGQPSDVKGESLIRVTMTPATGVDHSGAEPIIVYTGPRRINPSAASLVAELVQVSDFESTLVWGLGVEAGTSFAVASLHEPLRLVIDIVGQSRHESTG